MNIPRNPMALYAAIATFAAQDEGKEIMDAVLGALYDKTELPYKAGREVIMSMPGLSVTYGYYFEVREEEHAEDSPVGQAPVGED